MSRFSALGWRLLPVLLGLLIVGYHFAANFRAATAQPSPGWSRTVSLGTSDYSGAIIPAPLDSGTTLVFNAVKQGVAFTRLTAEGTAAEGGPLDLPPGAYDSMSVLGGAAQVDLFWTRGSLDETTLYHTRVDESGKVLQAPVAVAGKIRGYAARKAADSPAVFTWGPDGLQVFRLSGTQWTPVGKPVPAEGSFKSLDGQVLADGSLLALAHLDRGTGSQTMQLFRGTLASGMQQPEQVLQFSITTGTDKVSGRVSPVSLGADSTHVYGFYVVEFNDRGQRTTHQWMAAGPLSGGAWSLSEMRAPGRLSDRVSAGAPYNATAMPGQDTELMVFFQAQGYTRFTRSISLVEATLRGGKVTGHQLVAQGKDVIRPAYDRGRNGVVATFVSPAPGDTERLHAASSAPDFIRKQQEITGADVLRSLADTLFDVMAVIYPMAQGLYWFVPMLMIVGILNLFALNWAERNPRLLFWLGICIAVPIQVYVGVREITIGQYTAGLSGFLTATAMPALYVGIGLLMLVTVLRVKPPGKYTGALNSLVWWGVHSLVLTALLFGPLVRRG